MGIKLSNYARKNGVTYRTAWNRWKNGKLSGFTDETGHIVLNTVDVKRPDYIVVYCRVSSSQNRANLDSQAKRLVDYCNAKGWRVSEVVKEIGSGLNDRRPKLAKILENGLATKLVVEHKDRLSRFGVSYIEQYLSKSSCELHVVNAAEEGKEDLIQDFVSVITSFCARIYGQRRSKRKTEILIKELSAK